MATAHLDMKAVKTYLSGLKDKLHELGRHL
jgi:hypothetical protein